MAPQNSIFETTAAPIILGLSAGYTYRYVWDTFLILRRKRPDKKCLLEGHFVFFPAFLSDWYGITTNFGLRRPPGSPSSQNAYAFQGYFPAFLSHCLLVNSTGVQQ